MFKAVNSNMQNLAKEDTFADAARALFGSEFEAKMKECAESLKLISSSSKPPPGSKKFFRGDSPFGPQRSGGQASRRGRQPGGRIPNPLPGSSSPDTICWQRPNTGNRVSGVAGRLTVSGTGHSRTEAKEGLTQSFKVRRVSGTTNCSQSVLPTRETEFSLPGDSPGPQVALSASDQQYEAYCPLSQAAKEELTWWKEQLTRWATVWF